MISPEERKQIIVHLYKLIKESNMFHNYTHTQIRDAAIKAEMKTYNSCKNKDEYIKMMNAKFDRIKNAVSSGTDSSRIGESTTQEHNIPINNTNGAQQAQNYSRSYLQSPNKKLVPTTNTPAIQPNTFSNVNFQSKRDFSFNGKQSNSSDPIESKSSFIRPENLNINNGFDYNVKDQKIPASHIPSMTLNQKQIKSDIYRDLESLKYKNSTLRIQNQYGYRNIPNEKKLYPQNECVRSFENEDEYQNMYNSKRYINNGLMNNGYNISNGRNNVGINASLGNIGFGSSRKSNYGTNVKEVNATFPYNTISDLNRTKENISKNFKSLDNGWSNQEPIQPQFSTRDKFKNIKKQQHINFDNGSINSVYGGFNTNPYSKPPNSQFLNNYPPGNSVSSYMPGAQRVNSNFNVPSYMTNKNDIFNGNVPENLNINMTRGYPKHGTNDESYLFVNDINNIRRSSFTENYKLNQNMCPTNSVSDINHSYQFRKTPPQQGHNNVYNPPMNNAKSFSSSNSSMGFYNGNYPKTSPVGIPIYKNNSGSPNLNSGLYAERKKMSPEMSMNYQGNGIQRNKGFDPYKSKKVMNDSYGDFRAHRNQSEKIVTPPSFNAVTSNNIQTFNFKNEESPKNAHNTYENFNFQDSNPSFNDMRNYNSFNSKERSVMHRNETKSNTFSVDNSPELKPKYQRYNKTKLDIDETKANELFDSMRDIFRGNKISDTVSSDVFKKNSVDLKASYVKEHSESRKEKNFQVTESNKIVDDNNYKFDSELKKKKDPKLNLQDDYFEPLYQDTSLDKKSDDLIRKTNFFNFNSDQEKEEREPEIKKVKLNEETKSPRDSRGNFFSGENNFQKDEIGGSDISEDFREFLKKSSKNIKSLSDDEVKKLKVSLERCKDCETKLRNLIPKFKKEFPRSSIHKSYEPLLDILEKQNTLFDQKVYFLTGSEVDSIFDNLKTILVDIRYELQTLDVDYINFSDCINSAYTSFSARKKRDGNFFLDLRED